ncbi:hypothetical protein [Isoptericola sp. NPDC057653]|uniref:hypothetical protein n=1 Tax=unclassified Isoptericola TaxID=2623355 RepID=UPI00368D1FFD
MTLTTLLPTLRRSLPDPLARHLWPTCTAATTTDVLVGGVSMHQLARLCGTPCVHSAAAWTVRTRRTVAPGLAAVVVTTVTAVARSADGGLRVALDARPAAAVHPVWSELRLLGRASTAAVVPVWCGDDADGPVVLPGDLRAGDLLAVPCAAPTARRDVLGPRARTLRGTR